MTTAVNIVVTGSPVIFRPGPIPYCVLGIPGATGTILVERSEDSGTTFVAQPLGAVATSNSVAGIGSQATQIRVTATTVNGQAVLMDLSQPVGGAGIERPTILNYGNQYTTQATLTTELELIAIRFPVGVLKPNFRLELDLSFIATNNANVKTIRAYFGNSANTALEGGTIGATQVLTSSSGGNMKLIVTGRADGSTVDVQSIGAALGYGISTTAPISIATAANFGIAAAVEQALVISYQKATAADVLTLAAARAALTY